MKATKMDDVLTLLTDACDHLRAVREMSKIAPHDLQLTADFARCAATVHDVSTLLQEMITSPAAGVANLSSPRLDS